MLDSHNLLYTNVTDAVSVSEDGKLYRPAGKFAHRVDRLPPPPDAARRAKNCCVSAAAATYQNGARTFLQDGRSLSTALFSLLTLLLRLRLLIQVWTDKILFSPPYRGKLSKSLSI